MRARTLAQPPRPRARAGSARRGRARRRRRARSRSGWTACSNVRADPRAFGALSSSFKPFGRNDLPQFVQMPLDSTDRRMLDVLQREGRISNAALAERLHLSPSPCLRRLRALEREGYIDGYRAVLDRKRIGLGLTVFV